MQNLFRLCQHFLSFVGRATGLTYIQISVIFNLWVQGRVLVLSAFAPVAVLLYSHGYKSRPGLTAIMVAYALLYVILYILMLVHYRLPFEGAFYRCVDDLESIAQRLRITYELVNILIFVVLFLILLCLNLWMAAKLK